jgi:hypothetical protein
LSHCLQRWLLGCFSCGAGGSGLGLT